MTLLLTKLDQSWSLYKDEFSLYEYIGDEYDVLVWPTNGRAREVCGGVRQGGWVMGKYHVVWFLLFLFKMIMK